MHDRGSASLQPLPHSPLDGAPGAEGLWWLVEGGTGGKFVGPRSAGLIPRDLAVEILKLNPGAAAVAWLEQNGVLGRLPILVSMHHGFRMGVVEIPRMQD